MEDQEKLASCAVVAPRGETSTAETEQILGCTKQTKMIPPSASVSRKVVVDATRLTKEVSPTRMSILLFYMYTYRQVHYCHTSLTLVTQEVDRYKQHVFYNPIEMVVNQIRSPVLLPLLNVCSQSQVKWTLPVDHLCLRTP